MNAPLDRTDLILSRRGFLRGAGAVGVGAALADRGSAVEPSSDKKVRIGIAGGRFGCAFQWHEHPNCVVAAVADPRPDRLQALVETYGCKRTFPTLEEMVLADDLDAIGVFTPAPDHVRHCTLALEHGKHVISAVPAAMTLEECQKLVDTVRKTGLTYMMAETSYYQQATISARKFFREGAFGNIFYTESQYHHAGLEELWFEEGKWTWRHGLPPMHYPTHCTAHLIGVTGERLVEVSCLGWARDDEVIRGNPYNNPFWNETAFFKTDAGNAFRVAVYWRGAHRGTERAQWYGDKMSFFFPDPNGIGPVVVRQGDLAEIDSGGFKRAANILEPYEQPEWWKTNLLPEPLRHNSGHEGSHTFLTHEFIDALVHGRRPTVDVYEAVAYTAPGIVAHQSALKGGEQMKIPDFGRAS
ncbi:MAG: Gfo/Idh/MocA family oxidoreductase [Candidatus Omnitrophica bacterium]|nr:Gfo/Idh/MocA family oxidoreductase [Candidatus Omnitrophota bacterium]